MTRRKTHLEEVLLLLQQQLHVGMLQAGRASAVPPPWDGHSPWGSTAHCGTGVPDTGRNAALAARLPSISPAQASMAAPQSSPMPMHQS